MASLTELITEYVQTDASFMVLVLDTEGHILNTNRYTRELVGEDLQQQTLNDIIVDFTGTAKLSYLLDEPGRVHLLNVRTAEGLPQTFYFRFFHAGTEILAIGEVNSLEFETLRKGLVIANNELSNLGRELQKKSAEQKRAEHRQHLAAEILGILNDPSALTDAINYILTAIKRETGFEAVGIRLRSDDDFPYFVQEGFSNDFLLTENSLVVRTKDGGPCRDKNGNYSLECTCGLVISGQTDPANPLFTPGGSCWTNNSFPLLDLPIDQDPRLHPRNRCIHEGFLSVALIPIRANQEIIGLLQLNDRKKDRFTLDMIHFYEGISASIGVALMRKQAEQALGESEEQYRIAIEASNDGVAIVQNDIHIYVNQAYLTMFGYNTLDEMVGKQQYCTVHPDDYERVTGYARARQKGEYAPARYEFKGIRKDGTPIDIEISANTILYKGEEAILAYLRDTTEHKRLEEEKRHREKLEGVLEMAGTICHELNQPIQVISGYVDLLSMGASDDSQAGKKLKEMKGQINRMGIVTKKLMSLKDYTTRDYIGIGKIIDIEKSE